MPSCLDTASSEASSGRGPVSPRSDGGGTTPAPPRPRPVVRPCRSAPRPPPRRPWPASTSPGPEGRWSAGPAPGAARPAGPATGRGPVRRRHRRAGGPGPTQAFGGQLVGGQLQGQGQGALLPLGGVGPAREAAQRQLELVPVGPDQRDPPLEVLGPGLGQGVGQSARPRAPVLETDRRCRCRPAASSGPRRAGPARSTSCSRASTRAVPAASRRASHTSSVSATSGVEPPAGRAAGARSAGAGSCSTSSAARAAFGSTTARVSSRNRRRSAGPDADHPDVLGREHGGPQGLVEVAPAPDGLPVDHRPRPSGRRELGLDGDGPPVHQGLGPEDGLVGAPPDHAPRGASRGTTAGSTGSRSPRARWSCRRRCGR